MDSHLTGLGFLESHWIGPGSWAAPGFGLLVTCGTLQVQNLPFCNMMTEFLMFLAPSVNFMLCEICEGSGTGRLVIEHGRSGGLVVET